MGWEQELIDEWCDIYSIRKVHFIGYPDDLGSDLGEARYVAHKGQVPQIGIGISSAYEKYDHVLKSILWHELYICCKTWGPKISDQPEKLKKDRLKIYLSKPHLCIGWLIAPIIIHI